MANEEIMYFNVRNKSVRLIHVGSVIIAPETIESLIDDEKGINRGCVESTPELEFTDDPATNLGAFVDSKPVAKSKSATTTKTATGAGWAGK